MRSKTAGQAVLFNQKPSRKGNHTMKKRMFSLVLAAALLLCLMPAALADDKVDEENAVIDVATAVINAADETYYNNGDTVFNNGGTVFNNSGIVFNNGGVVFNNGGTVYNNGGMVYNNSGTTHNNGGIVEDNSASTGTDSKPDADSAEYTITLAADYSALVTIDGMARDSKGGYVIKEDDDALITPVSGVTITDATTTAGACTLDEDGALHLERVNRDGKLTLKFKTDAPSITPSSGSYGKTTLITITAPDNADIYYTLNGATPTKSSTKYTKPFEIEKSATVKAIAIISGATASDTVEECYVFPAISDVDFGTVSADYSVIDPLPIVVKNTGLARLKITGVALDGKDKDSFTLSTEKGGTVATGQSNEKTWCITPKTGLSTGKYTAKAVFTLDSGDSVEANITLTVAADVVKKA